jgi:hypothetical protein
MAILAKFPRSTTILVVFPRSMGILPMRIFYELYLPNVFYFWYHEIVA